MTTSSAPVLEGATIADPVLDRHASAAPENSTVGWVDVCSIDKILPDTGVCAFVNGNQIAIFRLQDGEVYAVGNIDPFCHAAVLSRGIVGDSRGIPKVASPVYKQSFDLRSGACLDDPSVRIPVYRTRVTDGIIAVSDSPN